MNVVFLAGRWGVGGVERVTRVLAEGFAKRGWGVGIVAFSVEDDFLLRETNARIKLLDLGGMRFSAENGRRFRRFVEEGDFKIVINQWCVPYAVTRFVRQWTSGLGVKLIAVHHNQVDTNKRIQDAANFMSRFVWRCISAANALLVYLHSNAYVVLCSQFIPQFKRFALLPRARKLYAISDPLTIPFGKLCAKDNLVLYVGRLEETQKRVSRVIDIWRELSTENWRLEIVGDGPDAGNYKRRTNGVQNIEFCGFCNPVPHYARGKLLLLTSDFEGFGLVIVEAMAHGCVPIVLGSYSAVYDIIDHGVNGLIVGMPYEQGEFVTAIKELQADDSRLLTMSQAAIQKAQLFSVDSVIDRWTELIKGLK